MVSSADGDVVLDEDPPAVDSGDNSSGDFRIDFDGVVVLVVSAAGVCVEEHEVFEDESEESSVIFC